MVAGVNTLAMGGLYFPPRVATHTLVNGRQTALESPTSERIISRTAAAQINSDDG